MAKWQAALRAVTYTDSAVTPNTATRTVTFAVNDGTNTSVPAARAVTVSAVDQSPVVTTTGTSTPYLGGDPAAVIDPSITVGDLDNAALPSATVSISSGFRAGDTLAMTGTFGNIAAAYDAAAGVLTLTSAGATATTAQWSAALSAVKFSAAATVVAGNRTIAFVVRDGTKTSATKVDTVAVSGAPILTPDTGSAAFVEADGTTSTPVPVSPGVTVADTSSTTLTSATISITGNLHLDQDVLGFVNDGSTMGDITGAFTPGAGTLVLTSAAHASLAQWRAALRAVTYTNTAIDPDPSTRTVSFAVSDASHTSAAATRTVTVAASAQTPTVTTAATNASYYRDAQASRSIRRSSSATATT